MIKDEILGYVKSKEFWIRAFVFFAIIGFIAIQSYQKGHYDSLREICPLGNEIYRGGYDNSYYCIPAEVDFDNRLGGEYEIQLYRIGS